MTGFLGCAGCNCILREEDGPLCQTCRDAGVEVADVTNLHDPKPAHIALPARPSVVKPTEDVEP